MKHLLAASAVLMTLCAVQPAQAAVVIDHLTGTPDSLDAGSSVQTGRLSRTGIPSDWSSQKAFPGTLNITTNYRYDLLNVAFAPNATQDVYYQISVDDPGAAIFTAAYNGPYSPANMSLNYLGDQGSTGNPFGNTGFFQVVVPAGGSLSLLFEGVVSGLPNASYGYMVEAFSDVDYNDDFAPTEAAVPEPATWAMMIAGFGLIAVAMRRTRRQTKVRFAF